MVLYKLYQYFLLIFYVPLLVNGTDMKMNDNSPATESACENVSTTCFPHSTESFSTEMSVQSTESDLPLTTYTKSTAAVNSTTTVENVTEMVTPKPEVKKKPSKSLNDHCHCDMMLDNCDINCCCDPDCKDWERMAFSSCIDTGPRPSYGQCISTDIIYKNNTPYPTTRSVGGLLCISKDNFPERNAYVEQEVIKSLQAFEKVWGRKKNYYWNPLLEKELKKFEKSELYKVYEPLWKYNNATDEAVIFDLPAKISSTSSACGRRRAVSYLHNIKTTCLQLVPTSQEECLKNDDFSARSFCQDLILIASPSLVNSSLQLQDSTDEAFIKVRQLLCSDEGCNEASLIPEPVFDKGRKLCLNTVHKFHLSLRHNGSLGITKAVCKITLGVPSSKHSLFEQRFEVEFLSTYTNTSTVFYRSGTPGYREGMPIITNVQEKGIKKKTKTSLTVISGENCMEVTPVLFKENSRIQCILKIPVQAPLNCSALEEQIMTKMLSGIGDIGVTGDPETWLNLTLPLVTPSVMKSACIPISVLSLRFLFAYSGPLLRPEAKIIGFIPQFDRNQPLKCPKKSQFCTLKLITMTTFTDASKPVVSKYASAPVVKIKLPQDFFYPFSSRAFSKLTYNFSFLLFTIIAQFLYIFSV